MSKPIPLDKTKHNEPPSDHLLAVALEVTVGHLSTFEEIGHINEELQSLLIPLLTAVENEADTDTHFMLRAVNRLICAQQKEINRLAEVMK
ncbi:hypothetical protein [Providencia rettgeri]|uniref:hypothetical protein n=1 Tax=Providencia rettgeri TaxID=587 RepID=UPI001E579248|nr:hypothetical protein [Providencia rettgeri]UFK93398.1 hypothetical protein LMY39_13745 [Providencia rettgeri]